MSSLLAQKFYEDLLNLVNSSGVTIAEAYFIMMNVFKDVEAAYKKSCLNELNGNNVQEEKIEEQEE